MNNLKNAGVRLMGFMCPVKNVCAYGKRSLWYMPAQTGLFSGQSSNILGAYKLKVTSPCEHQTKFVHTKAERELVEFLTEEILAERKAQEVKDLPLSLDGFVIKVDGAEVELTKKTEKEKIVINFNVNHTVDSDAEPDINMNANKVNVNAMRSKPRFEVDLIRGATTLSFTCSFLEGEPQEGEYNDVFGIDEMTLFNGEWNEKVYAVSGEVLDGYLYDLLMNYLEEKGISNEFVEKMSDVATAYEHSFYIGLLENISKFTTGHYDAKFEKKIHA